jgi:hypothetical protein
LDAAVLSGDGGGIDEPPSARSFEMIDPGALGTLIIRNNGERMNAERVGPGAPEGPPDRESLRIRGAIARGLRWIAAALAGPEPGNAPTVTGQGVSSLGLTWPDR